MSISNERGRAGEEHVSLYLADNGWSIAARNYRIRGGEIDIIAEKDGLTAFVEVKTRKYNSLGDGLEAVDRKKRAFIVRAAQRYIEEHPSDKLEIRFDVAVVTVTTEKAPRIIDMKYYENAFDAFDV